MSGGSFDYLYLKPVGEIPLHLLQSMAEALLVDYGYVEAAAATRACIPDEVAPELRELWHAVEWHRSNDWGPDRVADAWKRYCDSRPVDPPSLDLDSLLVNEQIVVRGHQCTVIRTNPLVAIRNDDHRDVYGADDPDGRAALATAFRSRRRR